MRTKSTLTLVSGILALAACSSVDGDRDVGTSGDDDVTVKEVASGLHTETASSELGTVTFRAGRGGETEKIIGTNDLTVVRNDGANLPAKYRDLVDAFGLISMGCTATHIGNGIVLTAGHCFNAPSTRRNNVACSESIQWGLRVDKAAYMTSRCQTILAYETNDDRDYAILRVSPAPTPKIDVDLSGRPATNTTLTIFGHPQARPLEWSQTCPLKPGSTGNWGADQFSHQCDTEPGNSGSTVLADDTLRIVGIHDGGLDPWNYGTYLVDTPIAEFVGGTAGTGGTAGGSGTGGTAGGSGTGGTGGSGGTACTQSVTATGLPKSIPDNTSAGVDVPLVVSGVGAITSLKISTTIRHTYRGDLKVSLVSPSGTAYVLSNRSGGSADDLNLANVPVTGAVGANGSGTWTLRVQDLAAIDVGSVTAASVTVDGACAP